MTVRTLNASMNAPLQLQDRRNSRVGLIAIVVEVTGFTLIKLLEMGAWSSVSQHAPEHLGYRVFVTCFALFALSLPLAIIGILLDKKKAFSVAVLVTFLPALAFWVFWSGYW